ncbi:hypothetical protein C8J56DRAFT_1042747 [Mycena floridula]|nr:hypothetical protein C8J56DRAFT_1042747 [Mycena floridula]
MVTSPSTSTAVHDEKKRKMTVQRAKANHVRKGGFLRLATLWTLSRQLQMRLQYARLKVDHGWQKQNLNEVENLYFRHSHMRGPRQVPSTLVPTNSKTGTTTPSTSMAEPSPSGSGSAVPNMHSNLSFKPSSSLLQRSSRDASRNPVDEDYEMRSEEHKEMTLLSPQTTAAHLMEERALALVAAAAAGPSSLHDAHVDRAKAPSPRLQSPPSAQVRNSPPQHHYPSATGSQRPKSDASSVFLPASKPISNIADIPTAIANIPTASDPYGFNSSSLTYDSFWASTSVSTRAYRGPVSGKV